MGFKGLMGFIGFTGLIGFEAKARAGGAAGQIHEEHRKAYTTDKALQILQPSLES